MHAGAMPSYGLHGKDTDPAKQLLFTCLQYIRLQKDFTRQIALYAFALLCLCHFLQDVNGLSV